MMRGTFANIRIKNEITPEIEGGYTKSFVSNKPMSIYDASQEYVKSNIEPLLLLERIWNRVFKRLGCKRN